MENKKQVGGKRRGAGRKPVLSKKKQISLYVEGSKILKFGNEEKYKEFLYKQTDEYGNNELEVSVPLNPFDAPKVHHLIDDEFPKIAGTEVVSKITGLAPKLSDFDKFSEELYGAKSRHDVDAIMKRSAGGIMFQKERNELKAIADKVMEDMFND